MAATGYVSDVPFKTTSVTDHGIIERSHETESYTLQKRELYSTPFALRYVAH